MKDKTEDFGEFLRGQRTSRGWTRPELAAAMLRIARQQPNATGNEKGLSQQRIYQLEQVQGKAKMNESTAALLARVLEIPLDDFIKKWIDKESDQTAQGSLGRMAAKKRGRRHQQ